MGDDASDDGPTKDQTEPERRPGRRAAPDAGWEARALARVKPHVEQLSKVARTLPVGWETDTMTRLEDYFGHDQD